MAGKIKAIPNPRLALKMFSAQDIQRLHEATLDVIENTGVRFPSRKALDIWAEAGAEVDYETSIVKAPAALIERALKEAPPVYSLGARDSSQDLPLDGNHVFVGTDGCGVEGLDIYSGESRRSGLQDIAEIARVGDFLEEVA